MSGNMPDATLVSPLKPLATGGVLVAPYDAEDTSYLPSEETPTGTVEIDSSFVCIGYMDKDANVVNAEEVDSEDLRAWGGNIVLNVVTSRKETYAFKPIEQGVNVWKLRYGKSNVKGSTSANAVVLHDGSSFDEFHSIITAEKLRDGRVHLSVIPKAQLSATDDVEHTDSGAVGYGMTFTALPYDGEKTSYDVYYTPSDETTTTITTA